MKSIYLLFLAISLGTLIPISFGGASYNVQYAEVFLLLLLLKIYIRITNRGFKKRKLLDNRTMYFLWGLCFIYSIIVCAWSNQSTTALSGIITLLVGLVAILISDSYQDPKTYITANRILDTSLLFQLVFNMFSVLKTGGLDFYILKNESSTLIGNSNYISFFFTFGLIYELIAKQKKWSIFVAVNLLGVILTISRGAMISIVICLVVYLLTLVFKKKVKKRFKSFLSFGLVLLGFYFVLNYTTPGKVLLDGFDGGLKAKSVSVRYDLWDDAISQIKEHPFGNGLIWKNDPHNIILRSLRDLGVVFGSVFLIILASPLLYFFRIGNTKFSNNTVALLVAYLSVFIHAQEEIFYLGSTSIIWTTVTIVFIRKTINKELKIQEEAVQVLTEEMVIG